MTQQGTVRKFGRAVVSVYLPQPAPGWVAPYPALGRSGLLADVLQAVQSAGSALPRTVLGHAAGHGDADPDQHQVAGQLAALAGARPDPAARFQADQGHGDAHGTDHDDR